MSIYIVYLKKVLYIQLLRLCGVYLLYINLLTPNDPYMGRTAPLTSKRCILYIYSTNIGTEYFKHALYSPFFFSSKCSLLHNVNCLVAVLFTFYIQGVLKLKKNSGAKGLIIIIINILTAIGLAPGGSSPVHIFREHYIEYTNNAQNT